LAIAGSELNQLQTRHPLIANRSIADQPFPMPPPTEGPINVYRVHPLTVWIAAFLALVLQTFLPVVLPAAHLLDLPLLVLIYFSVMRRSRIFGTLLGAVLGLAEDALSHGFLGLFGIANALVGYIGAWASIQFDLEQFLGRLALTSALVLFHSLVMAALRHVLVASPPPLQPLDLVSLVLLNSALALILFQALDRFRRPA
jgi:rod shape-determining protein MreD